MTTKAKILEDFALLSLPGGGIGSWLTEATDEIVFKRLAIIDKEPLSKVQLNQLLLLAHEGGVSLGFFEYYWLDPAPGHPYDVKSLPGFEAESLRSGYSRIRTLQHLKWGLYRLYIDGLLFLETYAMHIALCVSKRRRISCNFLERLALIPKRSRIEVQPYR